MKRPVARPTATDDTQSRTTRAPRAFLPDDVSIDQTSFDPPPDDGATTPAIKSMGWLGRLAWTTGTILVSLGLSLMVDRLIRDLFARYEWLGWAGVVALALFVTAVFFLILREILALRRLRVLDGLRRTAVLALANNNQHQAHQVLSRLEGIYAHRADLAAAHKSVDDHAKHLFDGSELIDLAERGLMTPLDRKARALTAASARRVALVTAVSPRALVDIAFVIYESIRLAGAIAALYGAKPGFFGFWRLTGAILAHLAVTGGLVLTDGIVEQLVGQGLAAKLSARLGEGVVNGLMTVRVGIAAIRVVRPLPFNALSQPVVRDFLPELTNLNPEKADPAG
ncbi:TIGR01620 family protein [Devosia rhodophyticola]|uniref:TIGR01620 family protein n=1 Tax=Devosia rhodophyticola TaxID=3026423 RepID=A0ABY7YVW6_9HYPH|nr:TIGR01620 family protein [Devosia rhodophyticola]WDR05404.1 TIGR01620 family protein [Devosia rhodophyticola]